MSDLLAEEFEVLESIYPAELTRLSDDEIKIAVEPDEQLSEEGYLKLSLTVKYPKSYPDVLPNLSLEILDGGLEEQELEKLMNELRTVGEENLGMAMTFTLASHLREKLLDLLHARADRRRQEESEKERLILEAEEARTRGTPVTPESFMTWRTEFDKEMATRRASEQEAHLKGLPPKEREEIRKVATRLTGRQLFERDHNLATSDSMLVEEGTVSIDVSQYDRQDKETDENEDETQRLQFSDSD